MRIYLQYTGEDINLTTKTQRVEVPQSIVTSDQLLFFLTKKLNKRDGQLQVLFNRDNHRLKIVEGWDLSFYQLQSGSKLTIQILGGAEVQQTPMDMQRSRLLKRLSKKLSKIEEQDQLREGKESQQKSYLDAELDKALLTIREGDLAALEAVFQDIPSNISQEEAIQIRAKKQEYLLHELGLQGWGLIHQAAYANHPHIILFLISLRTNVNKVSLDGFTPLQLAAKRNCLQAMEILLAQESLSINQKTSEGTALHVASRSGSIQTIRTLLVCGINKQIRNDRGKLAQEQCCNITCMKCIQQFKEQVIETRPKEITPPVVQGDIYKVDRITHSVNLRFMMVDTSSGSILRFKDRTEYPLNPKEVIKLCEVSGVRGLRKQDLPFYYRKGYFYLEISYNTKYKIVLGSKHLQLAKFWVTVLVRAVNFFRNQETPTACSSDPDLIQVDENNGCWCYKAKQRPQPENQDNQKSILRKIEKLRNQISYRRKPRKRRLQNSCCQSSDSLSTSFATQEFTPVKTEEAIESDSMDQDQIQESLLAITPTKICYGSFQLQKVLGSGAFGKVFLARLKTNGKYYALKAVKKDVLVRKRQLKYAISECSILKQIVFPFIVQLHFAFQTPNYLYLALDYCPKKDLSYFIALKGCFSEQDARIYIAQLILAIQTLHKNNIIYRDLKPQNLLIAEDGHLKLADFGLSKLNITDFSKTRTFCGTPTYLSPQMILQKGVGKEVDLYGIGTILYEMLEGFPPYYAQETAVLYKNIMEGSLKFSKRMSQSARNLLVGLLQRNPKKRLGYASRQQLKSHQFFEGISWDRVLSKDYPGPLAGQIVEQQGKEVQFTDFDYSDPGEDPSRVKDYSFIK